MGIDYTTCAAWTYNMRTMVMGCFKISSGDSNSGKGSWVCYLETVLEEKQNSEDEDAEQYTAEVKNAMVKAAQIICDKAKRLAKDASFQKKRKDSKHIAAQGKVDEEFLKNKHMPTITDIPLRRLIPTSQLYEDTKGNKPFNNMQ